MPLCKPGGTIEIKFSDDDSATPLTFVVRELSFAESCDLEDSLNAAGSKSAREFADSLEALVGPMILGWVNGPSEYSWAVWKQHATRSAFLRLPWMIVGQLGTSEKKA
jgi:hypothetical protein